MRLENILTEIGGFYSCDEHGNVFDRRVDGHKKTIERPFNAGMLTMVAPEGAFQIKRLEHVTYVKRGNQHWINYSPVEFDAFISRGCAFQRRST